MKALKFLGVLLGFASLLFLFASAFSVRFSRHECEGTLTFGGITIPITIYIKLGIDRWWTRLWRDSDAEMTVEVPTRTGRQFDRSVRYFDHLRQAGSAYLILDDDGNVTGTFSLLPSPSRLDTGVGVFEGRCSDIS